MATTYTQDELVAAVKAHAREHYNTGGWDVIEECYTDSELLELIDDAMTPEEAVANAKRVADLQAERRQEQLNEVF